MPRTKLPGSKLTRAPLNAHRSSPRPVPRRKTRNESIPVANATSITPVQPAGRRSLTPKPPSELQEINSNKASPRHLGTLGLIAEEKKSAEPSSSLVSPPITPPDPPSDKAGSAKKEEVEKTLDEDHPVQEPSGSAGQAPHTISKKGKTLSPTETLERTVRPNLTPENTEPDVGLAEKVVTWLRDDRESSGSPELPYIPKLVENVMMPNPNDDYKYDILFMRMIPDLCAQDYGRMHSIPGLNLFPMTLVVKKKPQEDEWLDRMTFEGCKNREFLDKYTDYKAYLWYEGEGKRS